MDSLIIIAAGAVFGTAGGLLLVFNGRIAGISGITSGLLSRERGDLTWRVAFVGGLLSGGAVMAALLPSSFVESHWAAPPLLALAGLLIGLGARLANGCTSGHGVCGVARFSPRSVVTVAIFSIAGAATLAVARAL